MQTTNAQLNTVHERSVFARSFGATRADFFTYPLISFSANALCTNSIFRSGSRPLTGNATSRLAPANIFSASGISTRKGGVRFIKASSKNKARRLYRALYSHYLYVSPYWA